MNPEESTECLGTDNYESPGGYRPRIGDIVDFTLAFARNGDAIERPAIVVAVWSPTCVNLQVFLDGVNDLQDCVPQECQRGFAWRTSSSMGDRVGEWRPAPR